MCYYSPIMYMVLNVFNILSVRSRCAFTNNRAAGHLLVHTSATSATLQFRHERQLLSNGETHTRERE